MSRKRSSELPPYIRSLQETVGTVEEIDARLKHLKENLSGTSEQISEIESISKQFGVRALIQSIDEISNLLDEVELEVEALELRISIIRDLKSRQTL